MATTPKAAQSDTNKSTKDKTPASVKVARGTTSFLAQVAELEVGDCCSRIGQLDAGMTLAEFAANLTTLKAAFRNNLMSSVRSAAAHNGAIYAVEITTTVTTPGSIYLVAIVTRTE